MATRRSLEVEELSQRIAPAFLVSPVPGGIQAVALFPPAASNPPAPLTHPLAGQGQGTYTSPFLSPDSRPAFVLDGQAALAQLDKVQVNGAVHGVGVGTVGNATGTLTFTNDKGSVTIELVGPTQKGSALLPLDWKYKVSDATGAYQGLVDQGMLKLAFKATPVAVAPVAALAAPQGQFSLLIAGGYKFVPPKAPAGVEGVAMVGPISTVDPSGVSTIKPLPGAVISIQTGAGAEVARAVADANGKFHIPLAPGKYLLVSLPPQPGQTWPRGTTQTIVVVDGQFTNVVVGYDSGPSAASTPPTPVTHPLAGQGQGTYTSPFMSPDSRPAYALNGEAALAKMDKVKVNGAVRGVALGTVDSATGTLTFTNDKGSVTIDLIGPAQPGSTLLPVDWKYNVSAATGAYQGLVDQGTLKLAFMPAPPSPVAAATSPQGTFTLVIAGGYTFALPPTVRSGVNGVAMIGPISPVDQIGVPNTAPLAGAIISIQAADGTEVARAVTDANGKFQIPLPPGKYLLVPLPPQPGKMLPRGTPLTIVVVDGQFADVVVEYDSGIR